MALGLEVCLGPSHIVLDGDPAPLPQKGDRAPSTNFRPIFIVAKRLDGSRCQLVHKLDGDPAPPQKGHPQFLARVYCGQTVAHLSYC